MRHVITSTGRVPVQLVGRGIYVRILVQWVALDLTVKNSVSAEITVAAVDLTEVVPAPRDGKACIAETSARKASMG